MAFAPLPIEDQHDRNLIVVLLDVSGSMCVEVGPVAAPGQPTVKKPKIDWLTEALESFLRTDMHVDPELEETPSQLELNGEIAICVFGGTGVYWLELEGSPVAENSAFYAVQRVRELSAEAREHLVAQGGTPMAEAIHEALEQIEDRKAQLHEIGTPHQCRPNIFLLTDGAPSGSIDKVAVRLHDEEAELRVLFWAFGTHGCDPKYLHVLANKSGIDPKTGKNWSNCNYLGLKPLSHFLKFLVKSHRYQARVDSSELSAEEMYSATAGLMDDIDEDDDLYE